MHPRLEAAALLTCLAFAGCATTPVAPPPPQASQSPGPPLRTYTVEAPLARGAEMPDPAGATAARTEAQRLCASDVTVLAQGARDAGAEGRRYTWIYRCIEGTTQVSGASEPTLRAEKEVRRKDAGASRKAAGRSSTKKKKR